MILLIFSRLSLSWACLQWLTSRNTKLKSHEQARPDIWSAAHHEPLFALEANFQAPSVNYLPWRLSFKDDSWRCGMMTHDCSYLGQWRSTIAGRVTWSKPSSWVHQFLLSSWVQPPLFSTHWSRSCFGITWPNTPLRAEFLSHSLNSHAQGHSEYVTMLRQWRIFW